MQRLLLSVLAALLTLLAAAPASADDQYEVRFGILGVRDGLMRVVQESRRIPLRPDDPQFAFGYELHCRPGEEIDWSTVATLPARPAEYSGDHYTLGEDLKTVTFDPPPEICVPPHILIFHSRFDPGDPAGNWTFNVLVNDKSVEFVTFEVYEE